MRIPSSEMDAEPARYPSAARGNELQLAWRRQWERARWESQLHSARTPPPRAIQTPPHGDAAPDALLAQRAFTGHEASVAPAIAATPPLPGTSASQVTLRESVVDIVARHVKGGNVHVGVGITSQPARVLASERGPQASSPILAPSPVLVKPAPISVVVAVQGNQAVITLREARLTPIEERELVGKLRRELNASGIEMVELWINGQHWGWDPGSETPVMRSIEAV